MVRHQQDRRRPRPERRRHLRFDHGTDVAGQQEASAVTFDQQHAGAVVVTIACTAARD